MGWRAALSRAWDRFSTDDPCPFRWDDGQVCGRRHHPMCHRTLHDDDR